MLAIGLSNGKIKKIKMKNEAQLDKVIQHVASEVPYIVYGYYDELKKIFKKQREELIKRGDEAGIAYMEERQ